MRKLLRILFLRRKERFERFNFIDEFTRLRARGISDSALANMTADQIVELAGSPSLKIHTLEAA